MRRTSLGMRGLAFLLLFPLLLTACWPKPLPRVVKIGLVAPFEGRYRYVGYDAIYAARLAIREINEAGGVAGWRLELVAYDDRGDAAFARAVARDLIVDPDVVAVIGHYRQESTEAAAPLYADAGVPLLTIGAWLSPTASVWQLTPSPARFDAVLRQVGWSELNGNPYARSAVADAELLRDGSSRQKVGGPPWASPEFAEVGGEAVAGAEFVTPYPFPRDVPQADDWRQAYGAMGLYTPEPGPYSLPTYEAVYVLAEAIRAAQLPSRASVMQALPQVRREGLLGTIAWGADGVWQAAPLYLYRWVARDGVLRPVLQDFGLPPDARDIGLQDTKSACAD